MTKSKTAFHYNEKRTKDMEQNTQSELIKSVIAKLFDIQIDVKIAIKLGMITQTELLLVQEHIGGITCDLVTLTQTEYDDHMLNIMESVIMDHVDPIRKIIDNLKVR